MWDSYPTCEGNLGALCELLTVELTHINTVPYKSMFPQIPRSSVNAVLQDSVDACPVTVPVYLMLLSYFTSIRNSSANAKKKE